MFIGSLVEMGHQMDEQIRNCILECQTTHNVVMQALRHSLETGGEHADASQIYLLLDCAEICQVTANFLLRESEMVAEICGVCAEICERCADACATFVTDSIIQNCADICRGCAQSCRAFQKTPFREATISAHL
jgi:hypothetical protein